LNLRPPRPERGALPAGFTLSKHEIVSAEIGPQFTPRDTQVIPSAQWSLFGDMQFIEIIGWGTRIRT
jgi:hypothetical protein